MRTFVSRCKLKVRYNGLTHLAFEARMISKCLWPNMAPAAGHIDTKSFP